MDLRKYVNYRRAELQAERDRVSRQIQQGISTGSSIKLTQRADIIELMLTELESFLTWESSGQPEFVAPLTPEERLFWGKANERGLTVPEEIKAQLAEGS